MIALSILEWADETTHSMNAEDVYLCKSCENRRFAFARKPHSNRSTRNNHVNSLEDVYRLHATEHSPPVCAEECGSARSWRSISIVSSSSPHVDYFSHSISDIRILSSTSSENYSSEALNPSFVIFSVVKAALKDENTRLVSFSWTYFIDHLVMFVTFNAESRSEPNHSNSCHDLIDRSIH